MNLLIWMKIHKTWISVVRPLLGFLKDGFQIFDAKRVACQLKWTWPKWYDVKSQCPLLSKISNYQFGMKLMPWWTISSCLKTDHCTEIKIHEENIFEKFKISLFVTVLQDLNEFINKLTFKGKKFLRTLNQILKFKSVS